MRLLTDATGAVTDRYDYDAFGNIISQAGSTPNVYLYSGEQSDQNLGFYYNRARYYSQGIGRFVTADSANGNIRSPMQLHRYFYANQNPVTNLDPSGNVSLPELVIGEAISSVLNAIFPSQLATSIIGRLTGKGNNCVRDGTAAECADLLAQAAAYEGDSAYPTPEQQGEGLRLGQLDEDSLHLFDCSGLVCSIIDVAPTNVVGLQSNASLRQIAASERRAGDVVIFMNPGKPNHVGFYEAVDRLVSATSQGVTDLSFGALAPGNGPPTEYLRVRRKVPCGN